MFPSKNDTDLAAPAHFDPNTEPEIKEASPSQLIPIEAKYPKEVVPRAYQNKHYTGIDGIIQVNHFYADGSKPGSGKTLPPIYFSQKYGLPLFVVCPLSVKMRWKEATKEYGVLMIELLTYQGVRSTNGYQPKHGYLKRTDVQQQRGRLTTFEPTMKLKDLIQRGCIFVFDECHNLKNRSDQWKACTAIADEVLSTPSKSRIAFISGTFFDKEEHSKQFLELFGIIRSHFMYRIQFGVFEWEKYGIGEVVKKAQGIDLEATNKILQKLHFPANWIHGSVDRNKKATHKLCHQLFSHVIMKKVGSIMIKPNYIVDKDNYLYKSTIPYIPPDLINIIGGYLFFIDKKNGYYKISKGREEFLKRQIHDLGHAVGYDAENDEIDPKLISRGTKFLESIEQYKVEIFIRKGRERLEADPKCKVICLLNYLDNIDQVFENLSPYGGVKITGKTKDREKLLIRFQTDPECRVYVGTVSVNSFGIQLDDKIGGQERHMFISPSYFVIAMHQASMRIVREDSKGTGRCRFVYPLIRDDDGTLVTELKILEAIAKKTNVIKSVNTDDSVVFPGDYEDAIEGEDPNE